MTPGAGAARQLLEAPDEGGHAVRAADDVELLEELRGRREVSGVRVDVVDELEYYRSTVNVSFGT